MSRERSFESAPLVDPSVEWTPDVRKPGGDRDRLLQAHLGLVRYIAHRIGSRLAGSIEFDELIADGIVGLIEAVERFDPSHDVLFRTYAETRIRGAILDGIRARDWAPRSLRRATRRLEQAIAEVEKRTGGQATADEIAGELRVSTEEYQALCAQARGLRLGPLSPDGEHGDHPPANDGDPLDSLEQRERRALVADEIENLPERERYVLALYYERRLTLKEIGDVLGVTESRVCQIHTRAVARLRERIAERVSVPVIV